MATKAKAKAKAAKAIGIVRVSQVKGREGDSFVSPGQQRDRIEAECERQSLRLLDVVDELDVSGGTPLDKRAGLRGAVEAIEAGEADVLVVAYFDRLVRSLRVQADVIDRVEAAGGRVLTVDVGEVSNGSAGQWVAATAIGMAAEFVRRAGAERSAAAQADAIARGVAPWPNVPPGYLRGEDGVLRLDPAKRAAVVGAFRLRAGGGTIAAVRQHLSDHGIERSYRGAQSLLGSRVLLGEIHFGDYTPNLEAHEPIVERELWNAVQRVRVPRGRRAKSARLLARLGVLTCDSCGGRMVVGTQTQNGRCYPFYRCGKVREDCERRVTISAESVEATVVENVRAALAGVEGRASIEANVREADRALAAAQDALDAAIRTLAGFEDEAATRDRLAALREARDDAQDRRDQLGTPRASVTVTAAADWDRLTLDERRELIRATVDRVVVGPGRGADRVSVRIFGE